MEPVVPHPSPLHRESLTVAGGRPPREAGQPLNVPIVAASAYYSGRTDETAPRFYQREGSPTSDAFEAVVGALDGGVALSYPAGTAAVAAVVGLLPIGATVVAPRSMYWGVVDQFRTAAAAGRIRLREVDGADTAAMLAALPEADLVWLEVASNPMLQVPEVALICASAAEHGVLSCVDATFATPLLVRPLELGADLVMHSATKYLAGHSDTVLGVVVTADTARAARLRADRFRDGAIPGALESFLALRGLRTLSVRLERQQANAVTIADRLAAHPAVTALHYPGRPGDAMHERWMAMASGPGVMLAFEVADAATADRFCDGVRLITHATSLGGVESLVERRARYEGERHMATPAGLLRLSIGIEHVEDLWADIVAALPS